MKKRILYVEDNPQNVLLLKRIMEAEGVELFGAHDGETGWEMATTVLPDLILMDLRLSGIISGFELTRRLRLHEDLQHTPILALSAYSNNDAIAAALSAGCNDFLAKPIDIHKVRHVVHEYLETPVPQLFNETILDSFKMAY